MQWIPRVRVRRRWLASTRQISSDSWIPLQAQHTDRCSRRDDLHPVPDQAGRPAGAAHCPAGEADTRFPDPELEADHRRHAEVENALNHMPSGRFAANGAWLAVQVMAHNLARWTARIGLGERTVITKTLRRRVFALVGRITRSARRLMHLPRRWPWETQSRALARLQAIPFPGAQRATRAEVVACRRRV